MLSPRALTHNLNRGLNSVVIIVVVFAVVPASTRSHKFIFNDDPLAPSVKCIFLTRFLVATRKKCVPRRERKSEKNPYYSPHVCFILETHSCVSYCLRASTRQSCRHNLIASSSMNTNLIRLDKWEFVHNFPSTQ